MKFNIAVAHYLGNVLYEATSDEPFLVDFDDPKFGMKTEEGYAPPSVMMQPVDEAAKKLYRETFPHMKLGAKPVDPIDRIQIKGTAEKTK